jgi:hypothetical protein
MNPFKNGINQYPATVEVRVRGWLGDDWQEWLGGFTISHDKDSTLVVGQIIDQPALYGLILKLRDLGLSLISVRVIG